MDRRASGAGRCKFTVDAARISLPHFLVLQAWQGHRHFLVAQSSGNDVISEPKAWLTLEAYRLLCIHQGQRTQPSKLEYERIPFGNLFSRLSKAMSVLMDGTNLPTLKILAHFLQVSCRADAAL